MSRKPPSAGGNAESNAGSGGVGAPPNSDVANRAPDLTKLYAGTGITVEWYASRCIHSANCVRALPRVFDPRVRPWVNATADTAERIAAAIRRCPSGALRYRRSDGGPEEVADSPATLTPIRNGPLYVRGDVVARALDGTALRRDHRMSLCRCDLSDRFPFCNNTCRKTEWTEPLRESLEGPTGGPESAAPSSDGDDPASPPQGSGHATIDRVAEASLESFPASDAPAWSPGRVGPPVR